MVRRLAALLVAASALVVVFAAAPVVLAGDPCFHSFDNRPPVSDAASSHVSIQECWFGPTVARVAVGEEVVWRNTSSQPHEVVGANLTWGAHEKLLQPGDTIGWTFDEPGIYPYSCMLHPGMTGAVVVGDGLSAGAGPVVPAAAEPVAPEAPWLVIATIGAVAVALVAGTLVVARIASRQRVAPDQDPIAG